ncbi:MAG: sigma-54 dependent transcriptional regulator [Bdellovibrionales bacterium]|nr:sigma-54 dependent transcriptional regulator [Bdellovibrionales bacterium]
MNELFVQIRDPDGHRRTLKWRSYPIELGTDPADRNQLRDPKLKAGVLRIERHPVRGPIMIALDPELLIGLGDYRVQSLELPFFVPIKVGDTELIFTETEVRTKVRETAPGERTWYTESEKGRQMLEAVRKASRTKLSVYLSGETGTGKEVLGRWTHLWSERASGPFVPINCGAVAVSVAESELFGHVKGAFTGAVKDRPGALLQAHGGTLFLDEVGDLPLELQVKLLRFLESGEIRPLGSDRVLHADVRIVCATHKPLKALVQEGKFRQDLYFRLASIPIEIPSLRSRPEDVGALAVRFAEEFGKTLTREAIYRLQVNPWPGNVRELRHAIERACGSVGPEQGVVHASDFDFMNETEESAIAGAIQASATVQAPGICTLDQMEKFMILRALRVVNGRRSEAARLLGIARSTLFVRMKYHGINGPRAEEAWRVHLIGES